jgi:hypothetical protein
MKGMISSYLASPKGQQMIQDYLSSPEGQKAILDYVATPPGKKTIRQILPRILEVLAVSPETSARVAGDLQQNQ